MESMQPTQPLQADLIAGETSLEMAASGKRLANYLIDLVVFYILLFMIGIVIGLVAPSFIAVLEDDSVSFSLLDRLVTLLLYALYMSFVEALFKGKSIGKLITGTRAVNEDGTSISTATAFKRGFSRAVPFCAFSALGQPCYPWQDKWTDTYVIDEKKSIVPVEEQ